MSGPVGGGTRREAREKNSGDDKCDHVSEIAKDERPAAAGVVDEKNAKELSDQGYDAADSLIFERIVGRYANFGEDSGRIILDGGNTSHLSGSLDGDAEE